MKKIAFSKIIVFLSLVLSLNVFNSNAQKTVKHLKPTVILISLDGFRYDYLDKYKPPTLNRLASEGVRAKWMIPSFPTKTFPNHYAIATGLYPEHNGIVENNIWDFGTTFTLGNRSEVQNPRWWWGEPIWVTAEKQGVHAGAYFFPGTEAEIAGVRPSIWKVYDGKIKNDERVDTVLGWFDLPVDKRPQMITMYFSDPDDAGHAHSPDSDEVKDAVARVDKAVARLIGGLDARKIGNAVNIIIVSDHGMARVDGQNAVVMDDYLDSSLAERVLTTGEIWQIFPKEDPTHNEDPTHKIMSRLSQIQHATCWLKRDVPPRLHYNQGRRVAPVICSADEGWYMTSRERFEEMKKRNDFGRPHGAHGYDNRYQSMMATFIARGRAFRKHKIIEPFENVDVYNIMCRILGLKPAPNDGDTNHMKEMLR